MNAKQYFFEKVAPEENGKPYHENYNKAVCESLGTDFSSLSKWMGLTGMRHSNDAQLDMLFGSMSNSAPSQLKKYLDEIFVGKLRNFNANAYALAKTGNYDGKLVIYQVGLSDLCFQYASMFYEHAGWSGILEDIPEKEKKIVMTVLSMKMDKLNELHSEWETNAYYIKFKPEDEHLLGIEDNEAIVNTSLAADQFILWHEVAHHILGHLDGSKELESILHHIPEHLRSWENKSASHAKELQADSTALLFMLSYFGGEKNFTKQQITEATIGSLLVMIVLGQLVGDSQESNESHPAVFTRFMNLLKILIYFFEPDEEYMSLFKTITWDMSAFYNHLYAVTGRGIGAMNHA